MSKAVIELQKDIINNQLDIISMLRKAHLIASKLELNDFKNWIDSELNGYSNYSSIPEYRSIIGEIKVRNPYYGLMPVVLPSNLEKKLNVRKIFNPMSEILSLSKDNKTIKMALPTELEEIICANMEITLHCYFVFGSHYLTSIIDSVKTTLLEWCIKLEKDGILGDEFEFNDMEKEKTKEIPQQIKYYRQVFNGNVSNLQIISGDNNSIKLSTNEFSTLVDEINKSISNEQIDIDKKIEALKILEDIRKSIKEKKETSIIKSALVALKDFLINVGASITASIIATKMSGF